MTRDAERRPAGGLDVLASLERALAVAERRRRWRLALALIALGALTTSAVLGVLLLVSG